MIAASLSYYALLAMFPAAIAAASIYGLVADPATLENQVEELTAALPTKTAEFVAEQLNLIVDSSSSSLGLATTLSILLALWSASAGTKAMISAINHAYGERETRSFLALRGSAVLVTLGLIIFGVAATAAVGFLPQILSWIGLEDAAATTIAVLRWPIVIVIVVLGLGALFKLAPNRPWRMTRWINFGAIMSAVLWVLATIGMSLYVNRFGSGLGETYGTLTGLIVLMLWFFVSGFVVLLGAETNSYLERHGTYSRS
jgi:membrane protein